MSGLTYVITGANRGIGKGLLETLILRPNTTVIAAVRDVTSSQKALSTVPVGAGSKIIVVKLDSTSATDAAEAAEELKFKYSIAKVDVLISNAGLLKHPGPVRDATEQDLRDHFEVNTIGPLVLIKAFTSLLEAASNPQFVVISSSVGSTYLLKDFQVPFFSYGISKAAVNYFVRKFSFENTKITSVIFHPGWVQTEMGNAGAKAAGIAEAPQTLEESVSGLITQFDAITKEKSGQFFDEKGEVIPW